MSIFRGVFNAVFTQKDNLTACSSGKGEKVRQERTALLVTTVAG